MRARAAAAAALLFLAVPLAGTTVSFYDEALPSSMNPLFARSMVDTRAHELVFDRLFYRSGVTNELRSRLVQSYELLDGSKRIKLKLREDVRWHDGRKLEPADVCFTVDALLDPQVATTTGKPYREALDGCEVQARENAAVITFQRIYHNPRERLGFHVLPEHAFRGASIEPADSFSTEPLGTGPMRGVKGRREVAYEGYDNGHHSSRITRMVQTRGADPFVQVRTLLNAGVHGVVSIAPPLRPEVAASDDVGLLSYDLRSWWFIAVNTGRAPLDQPLVRRALDLSLDREELRELTIGHIPNDPNPACTFISGPFVNASPYYNRAVPVREHDPEAAIAALEEAGAVRLNDRWTWQGEPITLTVGIHAPLEREAEDLLSQVGNQLQQAGFGLQVFKVTHDDWGRKALPGELSHQFDLLIGKWSFGLVEDVDALFHTRSEEDGAFNIFNYSNPEVDALLARYEAARTDTEARDAYHELHQLLAEDLPYLFLWRLNTRSAWRNEIRNNLIAPYYYFTEFDGWTHEGS